MRKEVGTESERGHMDRERKVGGGGGYNNS